jgi:hypothetical protein
VRDVREQLRRARSDAAGLRARGQVVGHGVERRATAATSSRPVDGARA